MKKGIIIYTTLLILLSSCDAWLNMTYTVENKTKTDVNVFIPNFPTEGSFCGLYSNITDTILTLKPKQVVTVGCISDLDFPFATRNMYRSNPGKCGIKIVESDTMKNLGCSKKEWKYFRRNSNLKIK